MAEETKQKYFVNEMGGILNHNGIIYDPDTQVELTDREARPLLESKSVRPASKTQKLPEGTQTGSVDPNTTSSAATLTPADLSPSNEPTGDLPKDFPYAEKLTGSGIKTYEQLRQTADADILAIDGIGATRLVEIRDAQKG